MRLRGWMGLLLALSATAGGAEDPPPDEPIVDAVPEEGAPAAPPTSARVEVEAGPTLANLARLAGVSKARLLEVRDVGVSAHTVWTRLGARMVGQAELALAPEQCLAAALVSAAVFLTRNPRATGEVALTCGAGRADLSVARDAVTVVLNLPDAAESTVRLPLERP